MSASQFHGVYAILLTPIMPDERVDVPALMAATEYALEGGAHGLVVLGSNGEGPLLPEAEQDRAITAVVERCHRRVPVLVGTGQPGTTLAVRATRRARELGADGSMLCTPYYIHMTQDQVVRHFETVIERCDLPILLYNFPGVTKVKVEVETVLHLARDSRVVGLKDSSNDFAYHQALLNLNLPAFSVFQSSADFMHASLWAGSHGSMAPMVSLAPSLSVALWDAVQNGDRAGAMEIQQRLIRINRAVTQHPWPAGWKAAMHLLGFGSPGVCLPNRALDPNQIRLLKQELLALDLLQA